MPGGSEVEPRQNCFTEYRIRECCMPMWIIVVIPASICRTSAPSPRLKPCNKNKPTMELGCQDMWHTTEACATPHKKHFV